MAKKTVALRLQLVHIMKQLFTTQYGIELDPEVDVSTQEKFTAYVDQKFAELGDGIRKAGS